MAGRFARYTAMLDMTLPTNHLSFMPVLLKGTGFRRTQCQTARVRPCKHQNETALLGIINVSVQNLKIIKTIFQVMMQEVMTACAEGSSKG